MFGWFKKKDVDYTKILNSIADTMDYINRRNLEDVYNRNYIICSLILAMGGQIIVSPVIQSLIATNKNISFRSFVDENNNVVFVIDSGEQNEQN